MSTYIPAALLVFCKFLCLKLTCWSEARMKPWCDWPSKKTQSSILIWVAVIIAIFCIVFDNFRRKNWRFYQKMRDRCYDQNFSQFSYVLSQKRHFLPNFSAKIFEKSLHRSRYPISKFTTSERFFKVVENLYFF
jgi:hypothetical protein